MPPLLSINSYNMEPSKHTQTASTPSLPPHFIPYLSAFHHPDATNAQLLKPTHTTLLMHNPAAAAAASTRLNHTYTLQYKHKLNQTHTQFIPQLGTTEHTRIYAHNAAQYTHNQRQ